ncbi:MAG: vWA domain-containing protein [Crocinitomicaceae bacterium]
MNFIFTYHPGWLAIIAVFASLASFWLYYRAKEWTELEKKWLWIFGVLRFTTLFFIGVLLLGIILEKLDNNSQKPIVFLMHDQSESVVQTSDSNFYKTEYIKELKALSEKLKEKYEVINYGFSSDLTSNFDSTYNYKTTNISHGLNQVYSQYANRNIGAIVLSTDGIFNAGQNPVYTISRKSNIPVFTIGLGDTNEVKDVFINEIINNDVAFLGNVFPVEIDVTQNGFEDSKVRVDLVNSSGEKQSKTIQFSNEQAEAVVSFNLVAEKVGYQKYIVNVSQLEGEYTYKNNSKNLYVNVIDGRQKILLTYGYTHPDISALNYVIEKNKNYDLTIAPISELKEKLTAYDLIIVHNYQSGSEALDQTISTNNIPILNFVGVNSDFKKLSNLNIGINGTGDKTEDVLFEPNTNFKDIIFDSKTLNMLSNAPPLSSPQGNIRYSGGAQMIAFQKIGNIKLSKPLIFTSEKGVNKYAVVMGEGIWRWRLHDQMRNETTENFANFFSQIITYLAVKENKDPFKINLDNEYEESNEILIRAELYNASYQLTTDAEVNFKLIDDDGNELNYTFFKTNESFILELGRLKQGIYRWIADTKFEQNNYVKKGTFVVRETKKEMLNLRADHRLLNNMSSSTNGQFYLPKKLKNLEQDLLKREDIVAISYQEKSFNDLIDYKWLFVLVFVLLAGEWFFRKLHGGY